MHTDDEKSRDNIRMKAMAYIDDYINFLERISIRSLRLIEKCSEINFSYTDMHVHGYGHDEVEAIFEEKLEKFGKLKYRINEKSWGDENILYLDGDLLYGNNQTISVIIKLSISNKGLILSHTEYHNGVMSIEQPKTLFQKLFS